MSIELTGAPEEVGARLIQLGEVLASDTDSEPDTSGWWTAERAGEFARELTDPSLRALAIIADLAPRANFVDVQNRMSRIGIHMAPGRLSSIGFAVRRLNYPRPPFLRDYYQRAYLMDEAVAEVLRKAIKEELARRGLT